MTRIRSYLKWNYFTQSCSLIFLASLIGAVFPLPHPQQGESFSFGFPLPFLTIHVTWNMEYAVHLGLGNLILNLIAAYFLCALLGRCKKAARIGASK